MSSIVEIIEGSGAGKQVPLTGPVVVGRSPDSGMVIDDELISRTHLRIRQEARGVVVEDLGSRNGTFVNDEQIHSPTLVRSGDHIIAGATVLQIRTTAEVAARPSALRPVPPALAVAPRRPAFVPAEIAKDVPVPRLDPLLDVITTRKARLAPFAVLALAALSLIIYFALR